MKIKAKKLRFQMFCLTALLSMLLSYFAAAAMICSSFYLTRESQQESLVYENQLRLNRLVQYQSSGLDDRYLSVLMQTGSHDRVMLYKDSQLLFDSFPSETEPGQNAVMDNFLTAECTAAPGPYTYRLTSWRNTGDLMKSTMALLYLALPVCLIFSLCLGLVTSYFVCIFKESLVQTTSFIRHVAENSYPPPLTPCGTAELDELMEAANHLSTEIKSNLSNYKEAIDAFIHEIKTPLTSIIGYSEMLKVSGSIRPEDRDYAEYIAKESQRLNMLTRKIIYFLSVDKQKIDWNYLALDSILEAAVLSTRARARISDISVEYTADSCAYLYGDEELLITCIVNILENAIKASSYGSRVLIHFETNRNAVTRLTVQDFGKGIPKSEISKIFQPFYMLHKGTGSIDNSLGLGLAICSSIAVAHHCHISVSSEVSSGTSVELTLPANEYLQMYTRDHPTEDHQSTLYILPSQP